MRYLAIDVGERRTGLAVGDDETGLASPAEVVASRTAAQRLSMLVAAIGRYEPDALVVGLPLNMDGSEGPAAASVRGLGAALAEAVGLRVYFQDERLSSASADEVMAGSGLTRGQKKARRDALAAAAILRSFLAGEGAG